jgi:hypothetical protein
LEIDKKLNKINYQTKKKYGGNIISREMISKDFYEKYYNDYFGKDLSEKVKEILRGKSILTVLKEGNANLIETCKKEFEDIETKINIMEILEENAKNKQMSLTDYLKDELEITAKLSKPFWSAVKNPEVSWTECYYIGAVKDDNITNGFSIKPHESIENWINNQTGERSRKARYVETTNPHAIDVIHITMGACAGYLPDIKDYKRFYLKLLSTRAYPLHLSERYIGLNDLDLETDKLLEYYYLSKAYGIIIKVNGGYVKNLKKDNGFKYIYSSPYCLDFDKIGDEKLEVPENKSAINDTLILGNSEKEVLKKLEDDKELVSLIRSFVVEAEGKYKDKELKEHMIKFISDEVGKEDFIAYEKLKYKTSV